MEHLSSTPPPLKCRLQVTDPELLGSVIWKRAPIPALSLAQLGPRWVKACEEAPLWLWGLKMVTGRWVRVSSPSSNFRFAMEGVWGLPRLREQGRLPGGGNAYAESPEVRKILLEKERGNNVSEMGRGGQRPGGLDWRGWER